MKSACKRLTVKAVGLDYAGNVVYTRNGNKNGGCTGEKGNCGCIHAEEELLNLMPEPKEVYLSHSPCLNCARLLVGAGVEIVKYNENYRDLSGLELLLERGITLKKLNFKM